MYMKSLVSLAVLGAMSAVATAGDLVAFDKPNESGVSGFLCLGRLFQGQPNEAALCFL
ncbi:hypothetical protein HMPREF9465_01370 [Sutterella wadsworthensis 2_1_59BFAA]|uniref:Uncharacterized protein n=1 Tax=Sutterella wadsworthensis 2_1_59BFAA TaxID=742823 RepID=K1JTF0_9BURK|nr:hypothetical protein [Sutterella wadsworthensis]EKB30987.1 hypothetical protein HMPREF9465_01370 [Sutterella wadsworthensis 2_1_59BFAA]